MLKRILKLPVIRSFTDIIVHNAAYLTPATKFKDGDIFIAGYPKSGNTWMQNLIAGCVYGINPEYASTLLITEIIPDIHYKNYYCRTRDPMFFKTHFLPRPEYKRVIYIVRDGRDVMVSYYHYLNNLRGTKVDFVELVRSGEGLFPCKWHIHVNTWLSNPYHSELLIIRYEDLLDDTFNTLKKICNFANIERSDDELHRTIENCTFSKLRNKEKNLKYNHPDWPENKHFFRRGISGSYKDEMPKEVLDIFMKDSKECLIGCGYIRAHKGIAQSSESPSEKGARGD